MSHTRFALFGLFVLSGFTVDSSTANATFITYLEGLAGVRGSLGGGAFTGAAVGIIITADTNNITSTPDVGIPGSTFQVTGTATGSLSGFGPFTFTDTFTIFSDAGAGTIGLQDNGAGNYSSMPTAGGGTNPALGTYNLSSSISSSGLTILPLSGSYATSAGILKFTLPTSTTAGTFIATLGSPVPEPSSVVMMAMGAAGLLAFGRRRLLGVGC